MIVKEGYFSSGSLDGCSEIVKAATKAEMQLTIFERMDWSSIDENQKENFKQFVVHAVAVVCDAVPEYVRPCNITVDSNKDVSTYYELKNCHTLH